MKRKDFNDLRVGDEVTLKFPREAYGYFPEAWGKRVFVPAFTRGIIGAVKVPFVRGPERTFICVDFPHDTKMIDGRGQAVELPNTHKNKYRVSAIETELV